MFWTNLRERERETAGERRRNRGRVSKKERPGLNGRRGEGKEEAE